MNAVTQPTPGNESVAEHGISGHKRRYRALAAETVIALQDEQSDSALKGVDPSWQELDNLPHWCVLNQESLDKLQRTAGALFLQPVIKRCVDGNVLRQLSDLVGCLLYTSDAADE